MDNATIWNLIDTYFQDNPQALVRHHIDSYNDFFKHGIFQIFKEKNPIRINTRFDPAINDYRSQCVIYFGGKNGDKIYFGKPVIYDDANAHYMYPNEARLRNMTYGMTIHYDVEVEFIKILYEGERPNVVGIDETAMLGGNMPGLWEDGLKHNFKEDKLSVLRERDEDKKRIRAETGGWSDSVGAVSDSDEEEVAGESSAMANGGAPTKRRRKKQLDIDMTPAELALIKEATEQSMVSENIQKTTMTLEKIYLGKFPIMLQSNYCILHGLPKEIRHTMGECLNDIGGYFIIDGKEKTVVAQEKFGDNMLYIRESGDDKYLYSAEIRSVSENVSKPIRTLSVKIVAPTKSFTNENIVVNIPNVRKPIPLFIVFRALGIISDKQIITTCLLDLEKYDSMIDLFVPSVHDAGGIMTQRNALKFIATFTKGKTTAHALEILADYVFPHIGEMNFTQKAYYLGYITLRLLSVYKGLELPTDRDNFRYKRIELVGNLVYDLFREYYTIQQRQIHLGFEEKIHYNRAMYEDNLPELIRQNYKSIFSERAVEIGFKKAFKGNWGSQTHTKRIGIVQDLNRLSFNSALSHLRKTNLPLDASVKLVGPRVLHNTQWGFFDPIDTPDGGNIGLHKHMAIMSYVTQGYSREHIIKWLRENISDVKLLEECSPQILSAMSKIIINGYWAFVTNQPTEAVEKIKLFRRNGLLPVYTSVTFDIKQNTVFIYTDAGRICRPIFYKDTETNRMSFQSGANQKRLKDKDSLTWNELITGFNKKKDEGFHPNNYKIYGLTELYDVAMPAEATEDTVSNPAKMKKFLDDKAMLDYIDPNETENALIAMNMEELNGSKSEFYTHMELHESTIFGMMCNLINFPENNPATRNSFSCGQSKQACSMYHTNHQVRMDKTGVVLVNGQVPLVKTRYMEHINNEGNPYGENTIVAIMCYTGYNVEDAILINEGSLKRGLFRTTYYSTYEAHEEKSKSEGGSTQKTFTNIESDATVVHTKPGYDYSKLDKYGIIRENTPIDDKTVLIGLCSSIASVPDVKSDMSKTPKKGQLGIVDKAFITDGEEGHRIAKVRIREERIPNIGDKMASRSGQKGTIGLVIPEYDMPFTKEGIRPDIIVNPHALPTRMTIGQLVECITGKASAMYGGFADCTAFNNKGSKIGFFGEMLTKEGYHSSGNEVLYNGMTGEQIETEIFIGPNYYMRLKHMVKDKINYRALGPRTALTKQPVGGRANDGGLRIGEMERDSIISHGAAYFLKESMMERGDKYYMAVCNKTGMLAIYNPAKNMFMSPMADGPLRYVGSLDGKDMNIENVSKYGRDFSVVCIPYTLKLLIQELQTINIQMRLITEDNIEQLENLSYSKNIEVLMNKTGITAKDIISGINREIMAETEKRCVFAKPESVSTPVVESIQDLPGRPYKDIEAEYGFFETGQTPKPSPSPTYPEGVSPAYEPSESSEQPANTSSPGYNPNEPYIYSPHSPLSPPPPGQQVGGGSILDVLSEQAQTFRVGEPVLYRGGGQHDASRLWTITHIGDKFIKIEPQVTDGLSPKDDIKIVTAMDIYRPNDFSYTQQDPYGQTSFPGIAQSPMFTGTPAINFAPVIKIVNDGNDFSTEPLQGAGQGSSQDLVTSPNESIKTDFINRMSITKEDKTEDDANVSGKIDFNRLVIKKL
jgi:DNA-directed RNA polymerase II subunit RPB2